MDYFYRHATHSCILFWTEGVFQLAFQRSRVPGGGGKQQQLPGGTVGDPLPYPDVDVT
jgi:hypothetical protein